MRTIPTTNILHELNDHETRIVALEAGSYAESGYDTEGAWRNVKVNGTKTKVYTKYFTGTSDNDDNTSVAHGVTDWTKILSVTTDIGNSASQQEKYGYRESSNANYAFVVVYTATNVEFYDVGVECRLRTYHIKVEYTL